MSKYRPTLKRNEGDMPDEMDVVVRFEDVEGGKIKLSIEYPKPESESQLKLCLKAEREKVGTRAWINSPKA